VENPDVPFQKISAYREFGYREVEGTTFVARIHEIANLEVPKRSTHLRFRENP
jgi:hypothetical protein